MDPVMKFHKDCEMEIKNQGNQENLVEISRIWMCDTQKTKYSYHFSWLGRPIIQYPQDIVGMQEIIWKVKPDLIIETGIAHGGSLIFYASMLELCALCGGPVDAHVLGVDIDIRAHNRTEIERHPIYELGRISMLEGSSVDSDIIAKVYDIAEKHSKIMVVLDSNHTCKHVLAELDAYAPLVSKESYCIVFDTIIEKMPAETFSDRPWGIGDNPYTAVEQFLQNHPEFIIDKTVEDKLLITVAPHGYLRRV